MSFEEAWRRKPGREWSERLRGVLGTGKRMELCVKVRAWFWDVWEMWRCEKQKQKTERSVGSHGGGALKLDSQQWGTIKIF